MRARPARPHLGPTDGRGLGAACASGVHRRRSKALVRAEGDVDESIAWRTRPDLVRVQRVVRAREDWSAWLVQATFDARDPNPVLVAYSMRLVDPSRPAIGAPPVMDGRLRAALARQTIGHARQASDLVAAVVSRASQPRRGRRPKLDLRGRLLLLLDIDHTLQRGHSLAPVAARHGVDVGFTRDLLLWAQTDCSGAVLYDERGGGVLPVVRDVLLHLEGRPPHQ